jgi:parvulin-like peptidyl-prolyl isomerase
MNRKWLLWLAFALFFVQCRKNSDSGGAKAAAEQAAALDKKVILTIGSVSLTNLDLKNFIRLQYTDIFDKQNSDKLLSRLFDLFCEQQVILFKANQEGVEVSDEEVNSYLDDIRSHRNDQAIDPGTARNVLRVQKFLLAGAYKDIDVSDAEIAKYYEEHLKEFQKTEEIELYQIMASDRDKLLAIRSELQSQPSRFEEIARKESIAPEAASGGAMGFFEKGMLPKEMEDVVFSLKVNEISPIVESPYGFHLFKVTRKRESRMQLLSSVKDEIRSRLLSAKLNAAYGEFLNGLKAEIPVRVHLSELYFPYINSESGVKDNEEENHLTGNAPLPNG